MTEPAAISGSGDAWDWIIFGAVYVGIAIGTIPFTRLSRSAIALLGAIAVVALNRLAFSDATSAAITDWTTLSLLFALMLVAASLRVSRLLCTQHLFGDCPAPPPSDFWNRCFCFGRDCANVERRIARPCPKRCGPGTFKVGVPLTLATTGLAVLYFHWYV